MADVSEERFAAVLEHILEGLPTYKACEVAGVDSFAFYRLTGKDEDAHRRYARAKQQAVDAYVEQTLALQDEEPPLAAGANGGDPKVDPGWVQWQKNRVEARRWHAGKIAPKKYGDLRQVEHSGAVQLAQDREHALRIAQEFIAKDDGK